MWLLFRVCLWFYWHLCVGWESHPRRLFVANDLGYFLYHFFGNLLRFATLLYALRVTIKLFCQSTAVLGGMRQATCAKTQKKFFTYHFRGKFLIKSKFCHVHCRTFMCFFVHLMIFIPKLNTYHKWNKNTWIFKKCYYLSWTHKTSISNCVLKKSFKSNFKV